jgi:group I intron endonuclease
MILSGIYRIKNIITNDCYVGSSVNIERRWKEHKNALKANCHDNQYIQNAYNKYGIDAFKYEILEICPVEYIIEREQERIDTGAFKFNISLIAAKPPDRTGKKLSDETKEKIGAGNKGKASNRAGCKLSAETRAKMSAASKGHTRNKGRKLSEETKAKLSTAAKGKIFSEEHKANLRAAAKNRKHNR